jgi:C_GCAxxG_C_C family probable redox protein
MVMEKTINGHTKREAMELAFKLGFASEFNLFSCSQSTFHAITTVLGYRNAQLFKALSPFENGGADTGLNSCGAFSGSLAVFGLFFGRDYDLGQRVQINLTGPRLGEKLLDRFHEAYGSAICKDIQTRCMGFSTRFLKGAKFDQAAFEKFEAAGGHRIVAPTVVGRAAYWAADIIWDELLADQDLSGILSKEDAEAELAKLPKGY